MFMCLFHVHAVHYGSPNCAIQICYGYDIAKVQHSQLTKMFLILIRPPCCIKKATSMKNHCLSFYRASFPGTKSFSRITFMFGQRKDEFNSSYNVGMVSRRVYHVKRKNGCDFVMYEYMKSLVDS